MRHYDNDIKNDSNDDEEQLGLFVPDYFDVYTSVKALMFDIDDCQFVGFELLKIRANYMIKMKGKKKLMIL